MSNMSFAPTSSAISRKGRASMSRGYAVAPATMSLGRSRLATSATSSKSIVSPGASGSPDAGVTPYATKCQILLVMLAGDPCVR